MAVPAVVELPKVTVERVRRWHLDEALEECVPALRAALAKAGRPRSALVALIGALPEAELYVARGPLATTVGVCGVAVVAAADGAALIDLLWANLESVEDALLAAVEASGLKVVWTGPPGSALAARNGYAPRVVEYWKE